MFYDVYMKANRIRLLLYINNWIVLSTAIIIFVIFYRTGNLYTTDLFVAILLFLVPFINLIYMTKEYLQNRKKKN